MVSVCLPSDALLQHLPSYLGFSYLGHGVSLHSCSSKAQPLLLTLDEGYLLTRRPSWPSTWDSSSRPSCALAATAPWMWGWSSHPLPLASGLVRGVSPPGRRPWPRTRGNSSHRHPWPQMRGSSSGPFLRRRSLVLSAAAPDLGRGVTPLGCRPSGMGSSCLLRLTSDL